MGEANQLRTGKINEQIQRDSVKRSREVFTEMDTSSVPAVTAPVR
jgi:hypothetical protein